MSEVHIIGVGQVAVTKDTPRLGRELAADAVAQALQDAELAEPTDLGALFVGNMMSGILSDQQQLGALVADEAGLRGIEAATVEAACASGAAAMRWGLMAVASGQYRAVVVAGVERMTHAPKDVTTRALATASDWVAEGGRGESFVSLNARLMQAYIDAHHVAPDDFAELSLTAHANALDNPNALFHKHVAREHYLASRVIAPPLRIYDASPTCNGAAALVLASADIAADKRRAGHPTVRVRGSASATDSLALSKRRDLLTLDGVVASTRAAMTQAGVTHADIDLFELHDAYTVISALSLEGAGFAARGQGLAFTRDGRIRKDGDLPIATMGGLKARGHPVGATGVYQLVEATLQLTTRAGACQVRGAEVALTQNIGGTGATVVTHVLTL